MNKVGCMNQRRSLRSSPTLSQWVIGLVSLGNFGSHKNVVAAKVAACVSVSCRVIAQEMVALVALVKATQAQLQMLC
jgi:hypothetical protein